MARLGQGFNGKVTVMICEKEPRGYPEVCKPKGLDGYGVVWERITPRLQQGFLKNDTANGCVLVSANNWHIVPRVPATAILPSRMNNRPPAIKKGLDGLLITSCCRRVFGY